MAPTDGTSDTAAPSSAAPSSDAGMMNSDTNMIMKLLLEQKAMGETRDQAGAERDHETKKWQFVSDKAAFDTKVVMSGMMKGLSEEISTVSKEVGGIKAQVSAIDSRLTALETGSVPPRSKAAGKGKVPVMRVNMSPRGADPWNSVEGDPWGGKGGRPGVGAEEAWSRWQPSANETPTNARNPEARTLDPRVGDRRTIIIGGFPNDTGERRSRVPSAAL